MIVRIQYTKEVIQLAIVLKEISLLSVLLPFCGENILPYVFHSAKKVLKILLGLLWTMGEIEKDLRG